MIRPEPSPGALYRAPGESPLLARVRATGRTPHELRAWAAQRGVPVPARGIVDAVVVDAYEAEYGRLTAAGVSSSAAATLAAVPPPGPHPVRESLTARASRLGAHGMPITDLLATVEDLDALFATTDPLLAALAAARAELDRLTRRPA